MCCVLQYLEQIGVQRLGTLAKQIREHDTWVDGHRRLAVELGTVQDCFRRWTRKRSRLAEDHHDVALQHLRGVGAAVALSDAHFEAGNAYS